MRALLIIVVVVVLLAIAGWLTFDFSSNSASVEVRTDKIQQDTEKIVEGSKQLMNKADEQL